MQIDVNVVDNLDEFLQFKLYNSTRGNYNNKTGIWNISKLNVGETLKLTIVARIIGNGTISNLATINAHENDTNASNNNASSENITALPVNNFTIIKYSNASLGDNASVGDLVKFTINITNNGPSHATDVNITDMLPMHLNLLMLVASML